MIDDRTVATGEAARLLGVAARTVAKWLDAGMLLGHRLPATGANGGHRRVAKRELVRFLLQQQMPVPEELRHYVEEGKI